jgi:hypothetical protein
MSKTSPGAVRSPLRLRKLRLAWSIVCTIVCVLLIGLWVRSYSYADTVVLGFGHTVTSFQGDLLLDTPIFLAGTSMTPGPSTHSILNFQITTETLNSSSLFLHDRGISLPYWLATLVAASFASLFWLHWQFSLRTLLIATTLVAVILGFAVYAARK